MLKGRFKFYVGDMVKIRTREEILETLGDDSILEGCLITEQMYAYCGRKYKIAKVVKNVFLEKSYRMFITKAPIYALKELYCNGNSGSSVDRCDKSCYLFWHERWLEPFNGAETLQELQPDNNSNNVLGEEIRLSQANEVKKQTKIDWDKDEKTCQLRFMDLMTEKNILFNCIYQYLIHRITNIKKYILFVYRWVAKHNIKTKHILSNGDYGKQLNIGDMVRVKSSKQINNMLDINRKYNKCFFMNEMYKYCGKQFSIHKKIDYFYDETKDKMCRCKDIYLLKGVTCTGKRKLYNQRCNRGCYFFWHKDWLKKL